MFNKQNIYSRLPILTFIAAVVFFVLSLVVEHTGGRTERVAKDAGNKVEHRIRTLESHIEEAMSGDDHSCLENIPEDMVIYKYVNDSLMSWANQFSVLNDDISNRLVFQRLTNLKNRIVSPLINVTDSFTYMNFGPKWYIVKSVIGTNNEKIIAGIEIKNTLIDDIRHNGNGVNRRLDIPGGFVVTPLCETGGAPVIVQGEPMFKVLHDSTSAVSSQDSSLYKWLGLIFICLTALLFLAGHRTIKVCTITMATLLAVFTTAYIWGVQQSGHNDFFSPSTYADGPVFFSLGAIIIINTLITMLSLALYIMRDTFIGLIRQRKESKKRNLIICSIASATAITFLLIYIHVTLRSILLNSNIVLEAHKINTGVVNSIIVYMSYIGLFLCILMYMLMQAAAFRELSGWKNRLASVRGLVIFSLCTAAYFSCITAISGFQREEKKIGVWSNRLAVERDLGLEIRLRSIEDDIATDQIILSLTDLDKADGLILNRISESYLSRIRHNYTINLLLLGEQNPGLAKYLDSLMSSGTPISDGSRFFYLSDGLGHGRYVGVFMYYTEERGLTRLFLEIEPNSNMEDRGYYSLLGQYSSPNEINIPSSYSYAKYSEGRLTSYKGNYPYPTIIGRFDPSEEGENTGNSDVRTVRFDGFTHFIHKISSTEVIVISRPKTNGIVFFTSFSYLFLIMTGLLIIFFRKKRLRGKSNFFRTKINIILFVSSTMILASMTVVSIFFVYKRNGENWQNMMSSRITTIQALVGNHAKNIRNISELQTPGFRTIVEDISKTTKSDITLYTPDGKVFYSTTPEVFDKMILGNRIDRDAFHNLRHQHQRFYIHQEKATDFGYWVLYAPIINSEGELLAIISVPYTQGDYDFRREAFFHAALLVNIFLLLLIISLLFSTREVNDMFAPLMEMGKKMSIADIHNLEPINYKKEDEISSLVNAYNRMVKELSDSTVRLAQAERDKAWSQMARQVAHEIKNPLTPIKLEIQRLIRLKENGNPKWEEKFDKVSAVVLEHIDILTETANEFSTFAKLYSEDPVLLDLDKVLKDQILIFDNRESVQISYIGMEEALIMGPRPQLIRVFVNLIANAIQAVEIRQKEMIENGETPIEGKVVIALRNSHLEGCYDIVVDDNGPGVKEENVSRLFTPNFTTKSGGTGLGLAICRNIIEKCEGTISYTRSFGLGGASFTVSLPKFKGTGQE